MRTSTVLLLNHNQEDKLCWMTSCCSYYCLAHFCPLHDWKSQTPQHLIYGFGGFKAITTCCLEHDIYILFQNARCQKSNILCKSSNILCKPYLPMFAPENSLLWRCIALLPATSPNLPPHPPNMFANPPCPSQPTQLVLCSLLPGSASLACPAWSPHTLPNQDRSPSGSHKQEAPGAHWSLKQHRNLI